MNDEILILFSLGVIGGGLKFIDEAFDENAFNKKFAFLIAALLVVIWTGISIYDASAATVLFAILAGVFLSGKIDNRAFRISAFVLVTLLFLSGRFSIIWLPFFILTLAGIIDERGNDYVDSRKTNRALKFFFLHRFSMKLAVFAVCYAPYLHWLYLFAFLAFDVAYDLIGVLSYTGIQLKNTVLFYRNIPPLPQERISFAKNFKLDGIVITNF
ncbi:MAG: hypothetical protein HY930_02275 [Euryarchaeota archaeon]|nr:hypothetical protein [Euryarchaeota archaeon]